MNIDEVKDYINVMNSYDKSIYQYVYARKLIYPPWVELITNYDNLSTNQIRDEFIKLMLDKNRVNNFKILDKYGTLKRIIPELEDLKGLRAGDYIHHPEKDTFIHTIAALSKLPQGSSIELILATILHDIAKPRTFNNYHFYNHAKIGAEMAEVILTRLNFDRDTIDKVKWLIFQHMRVRKFNEMKESKKIILLNHPLFPQLLKLVNADIMTNDKQILDDIQKFKSEQYHRKL